MIIIFSVDNLKDVGVLVLEMDGEWLENAIWIALL